MKGFLSFVPVNYHCFIVSWIINTSLEFVFEQLFRCLRLGWMISGMKLFVILYGVIILFEIIFFFFEIWNLSFYSYFEFRSFKIYLIYRIRNKLLIFYFKIIVKLWKIFIRLCNRIRIIKLNRRVTISVMESGFNNRTINYRTVQNLTIHLLTESEFNNRIDSIFLFERSGFTPNRIRTFDD